MGKTEERIILIDCDVLIHFSKAGKVIDLPSIFPYKMAMLTSVYNELSKFRSYKTELDNLFNFGLIQELTFGTKDMPVLKEYSSLKKKFGDGESACMAYARFHGSIIASSNIKDIKSYCQTHSIDYLTTMDFLCKALADGKYTKQDCDEFISNVINKGSKLPVKKMDEFDCSKANYHNL